MERDPIDGRTARERFTAWMGMLSDLERVTELLGWDQETVMPPRGAEARARHLGALAAVRHREVARADVGEAIAEVADDPGLDEDGRAMVRLALRARRRALALPERLVQAESELQSRCTTVWRVARETEDFAAFSTAFAPLLEVKREIAQTLCDGDGEPYDALLDEFEPGMKAAEIEPLFAELRGRLVPLVEAARRRPSRELRPGNWSTDAQMELSRHIAGLVGFEMDAGAIGITPHPFTMLGGLQDVRWSTHLDPSDPVVNVHVALHELGHALYDQGLPEAHDHTLLCEAPSYGAHESQSRFYEIHIGCGEAIWELLEPEMRRLFPAEMSGRTPRDFVDHATIVRPGPRRLEADEVTYNLHIILRFELELALVRGDLSVADLPRAWAERTEALLGVQPRGHGDGVLQDIHWAGGSIGYFPTYTLGNLYGAQLRAAMEEELGPLEDVVRAGRLHEVLGFMRERVHRLGHRLDTRELMRRATGRELGVEDLVAHLERRYLS